MCAELALGTYKWLVICPLKCLVRLFLFVKASNKKKKNPLNKQVKKTNKKATTLNIYCNYTGNVLFINTGIGKNQSAHST